MKRDYNWSKLRELVEYLAETPPEGEPCEDAKDGVQTWYSKEHVYAKLTELVAQARALVAESKTP